jgi:hypothetical protein
MVVEIKIPRLQRIILKEVGPFNDVTIAIPETTSPGKANVYLLTGPNGCGKSTVLYAVAAGLGAGWAEFGREYVSRRLRSTKALAAMDFGLFQAAVTPRALHNSPLRSPFSPNIDLQHFSTSREGSQLYVGGESQQNVESYEKRAFYDTQLPPEGRHRHAWAAFAYAGTRSIENYEVTAIQALKHAIGECPLSTLANSLACGLRVPGLRRLLRQRCPDGEITPVSK